MHITILLYAHIFCCYLHNYTITINYLLTVSTRYDMRHRENPVSDSDGWINSFNSTFPGGTFANAALSKKREKHPNEYIMEQPMRIITIIH